MKDNITAESLLKKSKRWIIATDKGMSIDASGTELVALFMMLIAKDKETVRAMMEALGMMVMQGVDSYRKIVSDMQKDKKDIN